MDNTLVIIEVTGRGDGGVTGATGFAGFAAFCESLFRILAALFSTSRSLTERSRRGGGERKDPKSLGERPVASLFFSQSNPRPIEVTPQLFPTLAAL